MEEVTNTNTTTTTTTTTTYEALINHLFCDDLFHTDFPSASSSIFMPEEPIGAQCLNDENGTNHKSNKKLKPRKIQQERRPWLNQKPSNDQSNSGNEEAKQKHKLQSPAMKNKKHDNGDRTLYQDVMEEVANKTRQAFLEHYADDSVHLQFLQLWKLKMKNKKVKLGCLAGKLPPASIEAPLSDRKPAYEKDPQLASLQTTTSIPLQPLQFDCLPGYQDGNGRMSKSAAYRKLRKLGSSKEQQPSRPWLGNAGTIPKKIKLRNAAKKQELHQPWLKQKPLDSQNNAGLVELRQTFRLQAHDMSMIIGLNVMDTTTEQGYKAKIELTHQSPYSLILTRASFVFRTRDIDMGVSIVFSTIISMAFVLSASAVVLD